MLYWIHALVLLGLSLGALRLWGGRSALRNYWFPLFFLLTSLAWPSKVDEWVSQGLQRGVARATVEVVGLFNVPAIQHGNLVEVATGTVGIDEACSGIRSLQASIMLALLLGELFLLRPWQRILLLPFGVLVALAANLGRTTLLTWRAAKQGMERMHAWHGPAGIAVVGVVMGGLYLLAWLFREKLEPEVRSQRAEVGGQRAEGRVQRSEGGGQGSEVRGQWSVVSGQSRRPLPLGILILCCLWIPATEGLTWGWYHWPGKEPVAAVPWSIQWPTNAPGFASVSVPKRQAEQLRCAENAQASWTDQYGNQWNCVLLSWAPVESLELYVGGHNPEVCMTAAGSRFIGKVAPVIVQSGGFSMRFNHRLFEQEHRLLHVFQGTWEPFVPPLGQRLFGDYSSKARIGYVLERRLIRGGITLEFVVTGPATEEEARKLFQRQLAQLIVPGH